MPNPSEKTVATIGPYLVKSGHFGSRPTLTIYSKIKGDSFAFVVGFGLRKARAIHACYQTIADFLADHPSSSPPA